jgi:hypothetical protein
MARRKGRSCQRAMKEMRIGVTNWSYVMLQRIELIEGIKYGAEQKGRGLRTATMTECSSWLAQSRRAGVVVNMTRSGGGRA